MISQIKFTPAQLYKISYSKTYLQFEIGLFTILLISLIFMLSGWWLTAWFSLTLLLAVRYFAQQSIIHQYSQYSAIEFRLNPARLIWYDQHGENSFPIEQVDCYISRWFILVKMRDSKLHFNRLILADSFHDITHYTRFRRQLIEILDAS